MIGPKERREGEEDVNNFLSFIEVYLEFKSNQNIIIPFRL